MLRVYGSIRKKPIHVNYSVLTKEIESSHKAPKFKFDDWERITKYKNFCSKGYTKNWSRENVLINSVLKTNPSTYKIKDLKGETIIESLYEK